MFERSLILLAALLFVSIAALLWRTWQARRLQQIAAADLPTMVAALLPAGPALLYFTTADCAQCKYQQQPILNQLAQSTQVAIHTVDAVEEVTLTDFFGILTVPSTVWIDQRSRPTAINHGLAKLETLRAQAAQSGLA